MRRVPGLRRLRAPQSFLDRAARPARVVFVFLDFGEGGAQRGALEAMRRLDRRRFEPVLLCVRRRGALVDAAVEAGAVVRLLGRMERARDPRAVTAIAAALRELRADAVIVQHYSRVLPYALAASRVAGVPQSIVQHQGHRPPRGRARRAAERVLRPGLRYLAISAATAAALRADGAPAADIALVPHGVDLLRFAPRDRATARADLELERDRPIVLVPARLDPVKGHADLLAALPALRERVPDVLVVCVGDGPLRRTLPALARAAGLAEAVRFVGHRKDMPRWLAACDLVCLPSRAEGLSLALLEAHAAGRASIASAVGGIPEVIVDRKTGLLVPPRSSALLASALASLLEHPDGCAVLARAARQRAEAHFSADTSARRLEDALAGWLAAAGRPVPDRKPNRSLASMGAGRDAGATGGDGNGNVGRDGAADGRVDTRGDHGGGHSEGRLNQADNDTGDHSASRGEYGGIHSDGRVSHDDDHGGSDFIQRKS